MLDRVGFYFCYRSNPLKTPVNHIILFVFLLCSKLSSGQGRVVINEYMSWSGCNTTSEFIELLNFGPGPVNIGCYIVTNGKYSVTIPPNTFIRPKQYFIISGQDVLSRNCGNADSAITVDLNWNSINCTNVPIPKNGDGFLKNGGGANEKIILLDPYLNVIDAVSRDIPVSSSVSITTPALAGGCGSQTFDLSTMSISYETIGRATGIDNSYARKVDGDCGWEKTTAISANAPNKTGSTASAKYDFSTLNASECGGTTGSISIQMTAEDVTSLFPMSYTIGFDADSNDTFNSDDQYVQGVDNMGSAINIKNLAYGRYRITVASNSSCNLKSFDFFIFNCYGIALPVALHYFRYEGIHDARHLFRFKVDEASSLATVVLEGGNDGLFQPVTWLYGPFTNEYSIKADLSKFSSYRLKLVNHSGVVSYSQEIKVEMPGTEVQFWPNPVKDRIFIKLHSTTKGKLSYSILNSFGASIKKGTFEVNVGEQVVSVPATDLKDGIYYFSSSGPGLRQTVSFRFIK